MIRKELQLLVTAVLFGLAISETPCEIKQAEYLKDGHHIQVTHLGKLISENKVFFEDDLSSTEQTPERLYGLGGETFLLVEPTKGRYDKYLSLDDLKVGKFLSLNDDRGYCDVLTTNQFDYEQEQEQETRGDGYLPTNYIEEPFSVSARHGDFECQLMKFKIPETKFRGGEDQKYTSELILLCYIYKNIDEKDGGSRMMVAKNYLDLDAWDSTDPVKSLHLEITDNTVKVTVLSEDRWGVEEAIVELPYPGYHLYDSKKLYRAFLNSEFKFKKQDKESKGENEGLKNSLENEFQKKYSFYKEENNSHIELKDAHNHYCIDFPLELLMKHSIFQKNGPGPYTWRISEEGRKFSMWSLMGDRGNVLKKVEFMLGGSNKVEDKAGPGKLERFKNFFRREKKRI